MNPELTKKLSHLKRLISERKKKKALSLLKDLIAAFPDEQMLYLQCAIMYEESGDTERAVDILRKGLEHIPGDFSLRRELAYYLLMNEENKESEALYRELIDTDMSTTPAIKSSPYNSLGEALIGRGQENEAIEAWKTALELDPGNESASENLFMYTEGLEHPDTPQWIKDNANLVDAVIACVENSVKESFEPDHEEHVSLVRDQYNVAMELSKLVTSKDMVYDLSMSTIYDLYAWLFDLPFTLARFGMVEEALNLGETWAKIDDADIFLGDRCVILAESGLKDQTYKQIEQLLKDFSDNAWVRIKIGDAYAEFGEWEKAEQTYRYVLSMPNNDDGHDGAVERLITLYKRTGRNDEADQLESEHFQQFDDLEEAYEIVEPRNKYQLFKVPPKTGRNSPCPCGSGKKYKKCCGKN
jgi:tetratricopeptide (TPR) repeat protein